MNFPDRIAHFLNQTPVIPDSAFVAPGAVVTGAVTLGEQSSVWYHTTIRADINSIQIGPRTNIQDGVVIHVADAYGARLGELVTVGHRAVVHACTVHDEVLVGMGAIILDGAEIGARSIVGAGALVTGRKKIPPGSLVLGSPATVVRALDVQDQNAIKQWALRYVEVSRAFMERARENGA